MNTVLLDGLFCANNLPVILIGLLGSALLGYLIRHFMNKNSGGNTNEWQSKHDAIAAELAAEKTRYAKLQAESKKKKGNNSDAQAMSVPAVAPGGMSANEAEQLNNKLRNMKAELKTITDEKIRIEGDLNAANSRAREANTLNSEVETLKTRIEGLNRALEASKADAEKYKQDFEAANSERTKLSATLSTSEVGTLKSRIQKLETDLDNSRMNVSNLTVQLSNLRNGPKTVGSVIDNANKDENSAKDLKAKVAALEIAAQKFEEEKERLTKEIAFGNMKVTAAVNQANEKNNAEIIDLRDRVKFYEAKISRLEDEKTKLAANAGAVSTGKISLDALPEVPKANTESSFAAPTPEVPKAAPAKEVVPEVVNRAAEPVIAEANTTDDLTIVEGIGPKIAEVLNANGINSFKQLADSKESELQVILESAGGIIARSNPSTWAEQAALLRDGKKEEFDALAAELMGGVRVDKNAEAAEDAAALADAKSNPDDLKVIEGIGPVLEKTLNDGGVYTYAQIAHLGADALKAILEAAGDNLHDPATWPEQAALLRDGKMDEFKALTDELKGGRRD